MGDVPMDARPVDHAALAGNGADGPGGTARGPTWWRRHRFEMALVVIALVGLGFRVGYIAATRGSIEPCSNGQRVCGDQIYYSAQAHAIARGQGYTSLFDPSVQTADHPPLTALVLAPASLLSPGSDIPVTMQRLIMALLGFAVILAIGLLGRRAGGTHGDAVGLIAAGFAVVNANLWMNDVILMAETPGALALVVTLLALYRFIDRPSLGRAVAVGALAAVAGLARAELLLLLPITFVPIALWARSIGWAARLGRIAVAAVAAIVVLAPWTIFNLTRFDQPVMLSTNDGITLVGANCDDVYGNTPEGAVGFWQLRCIDPLESQVPPGADQSVRSSVYRRAGIDYITTHKSQIPKVELYRLGRGWGVYRPKDMVWLNQGEGRREWASWLGFWQWWLLIVPAVSGAVILRRRRQPVWPLASMAIIVTTTIMVFYGIIRFRMPADIAAVVLAAVAVDALVRRLFGRAPAPGAADTPSDADADAGSGLDSGAVAGAGGASG